MDDGVVAAAQPEYSIKCARDYVNGFYFEGGLRGDISDYNHRSHVVIAYRDAIWGGESLDEAFLTARARLDGDLLHQYADALDALEGVIRFSTKRPVSSAGFSPDPA